MQWSVFTKSSLEQIFNLISQLINRKYWLCLISGKFDHSMVKNWATQLTEHRKMSETNKESASDSENNKTEKV